LRAEKANSFPQQLDGKTAFSCRLDGRTVFQKRTTMDILFFAKVLRATVLGARKFILSIFLFLENGGLMASARFERVSILH
jgi:hypothetical protein